MLKSKKRRLEILLNGKNADMDKTSMNKKHKKCRQGHKRQKRKNTEFMYEKIRKFSNFFKRAIAFFFLVGIIFFLNNQHYQQ
jgi:hypothetical protein